MIGKNVRVEGPLGSRFGLIAGELDTENGAEVYRHLRELQTEQRSTVISVTHDRRYIRDSDLVFEIRDGQLVNGTDGT